ncbi:MAG: hypothetical protein ABGU93_04660 [Acetobacterium sp.]|uniref:hypothetical protein n=1 Tax=Acetobacterium sp. TaxID=1872094 RepID=UPI003242E529
MKKRKKLWIVDFGEALTKIVVSAITETGQIQIKDIRIEKTPDLVWGEGDPENKLKVGGFLRALLKGYRRKDEVMLLINHKEMMVAAFTFPMMTLTEVEDAVYWQMQLLTAENLEHWRIDFVAREHTEWFECLGMDEKKLDVLGVGVEKERLSWYSRIFKKSGCSLQFIVPQFYTFASLVNLEVKQATLMIDMGKTCTRLFYYYGDSLIENHRLELENGWDGEIYLQQIIKAAEQIFMSPLKGEIAGKTGNIYLMGGESLHAGVLEYLTKWMPKEIQPSYSLFDEKEELIFSRQMSKAELCLLTPCLCGLIKWVQVDRTGGLYEA